MDRKERLRSQLDRKPFLEAAYEAEKIDRDPSKLRVFGRKVMDMVGIHSARSERMRDREAMSTVLAEYREDKERRRLELLEFKEKKRLRDEALEREIAERSAANDRALLEADMSSARDLFERRKKSMFEGQRTQELVERELGGKLTTVESLEEAVMAEEEGVSKRIVEYEDEEIVVYDLTGLPFCMISHAVDYRYANWSKGIHDIGNKTAQDLLEHPELWDRTREEVEAESSYGTRQEDALGDVISGSYVNSEMNIDTRVSKFGSYYTLCYGFEAVRPDSVLYISGGDGGTTNTGGKGETLLSGADRDVVKGLEGAGGSPGYNEITSRRYDESGRPLRPSYIIVEDGHITEAALRHAKYFGIPIVNIVRKPYEDRLEKKAEEALDGVSEESSYDEITAAISTLRRAPKYFHKFHPIESMGRAKDSVSHDREKGSASPGSMEEKIVKLEELELRKRLDLIEEALRSGKENGSSRPEGFSSFYVSETRVREVANVPGNCDYFTIEFRRKGAAKRVSTSIYDGENVVRGDEAVQRGNMTQEDLDAGDSTEYRRFAPLVKAWDKR